MFLVSKFIHSFSSPSLKLRKKFIVCCRRRLQHIMSTRSSSTCPPCSSTSTTLSRSVITISTCLQRTTTTLLPTHHNRHNTTRPSKRKTISTLHLHFVRHREKLNSVVIHTCMHMYVECDECALCLISLYRIGTSSKHN